LVHEQPEQESAPLKVGGELTEDEAEHGDQPIAVASVSVDRP
jgi:hypothetical protein